MGNLSTTALSPELLKVIKVTKKYIRKNGYCYPALHIFKKGEHIEPRAEVPNFLASNSTSFVSNEDTITGEETSHSILAFSIDGDEDVDRINRVAKRIVREHSPDAVAMVMSCIYRSDEILSKIMEEKDPQKRDELKAQCGTKILMVCAYVKGHDDYFVKYIPFVNFGRLEEEDKGTLTEEELEKYINEIAKSGDFNNDKEVLSRKDMSDDGPYNIGFAETPWMGSIFEIDPCLENPYID